MPTFTEQVAALKRATQGTYVEQLQPWQKLRAYDTGITPEVATNLVRAASSSSDGQRRLFETMLSRDADLRNAWTQRMLGIISASWRFLPAEDLTEEQAKPVFDAGLPPTGFRRVLEHLAGFRGMGYAVAEIEWGPAWTVKALHVVPYQATQLIEGELYLWTPDRQIKVTDPELQGRLIVALADPHDPAGAALLRTVVGPWVTKAYLARDWRRYLERFGDPWAVGTYPSTAMPDANGVEPKDALLGAIEAMKASGNLAKPEGTDIELLADTTKGATSAAFEALWDRSNESIYRALLGQSSTVAQGENGSRASDTVRERTLDAICEADAALMAEILQEQLVDVVASKRAGGRKLVEIHYSWEREAPPLERAEVFVKAKAAGIEFNLEAARQELGLEAPSPEQLAEEEARRQAMADALAGAPPAPDEDDDPKADAAPTALAARRRIVHALRAGVAGDQEALDVVSGRSAAHAGASLANDLASRVREAVSDDATPQEADRALQEAVSDEVLTPLAAIFERAILAAAYTGRSNARAWSDRHRSRRA